MKKKKKPLNVLELNYITETKDFKSHLENSDIDFNSVALARVLKQINDETDPEEREKMIKQYWTLSNPEYLTVKREQENDKTILKRKIEK